MNISKDSSKEIDLVAGGSSTSRLEKIFTAGGSKES
jgi:hypothetical protein